MGKKLEACRYDELRAGDVIWFHGARERIKEVWNYPNEESNPFYDRAKSVIRFELEPADDEAVETLGSFYSHGTYGGVGCIVATREVSV